MKSVLLEHSTNSLKILPKLHVGPLHPDGHEAVVVVEIEVEAVVVVVVVVLVVVVVIMVVIGAQQSNPSGNSAPQLSKLSWHERLALQSESLSQSPSPSKQGHSSLQHAQLSV